MGQRSNKAFALVIFTPDIVMAADQELLMAGEGVTVRVPLEAFITAANWPNILPLVQKFQEEKDKHRNPEHGWPHKQEENGPR